MTGKNRENYNKNYIAYVNSFAPPTHHFKNCLRAFGVGGLICCIGQFLRYMLEYLVGLSGDELAGTVYYRYGDNKTEQAARAYWEKIKDPGQ